MNNKYNFSENNYNLSVLNIKWITGFCDAESYLLCHIIKSNTKRIKWIIIFEFGIGLRKRDLNILKDIKAFLNRVDYITIRNLFIIDHFIKYPLNIFKLINLYIFKEIYDLKHIKIYINILGFILVATLTNKINKPLSTKWSIFIRSTL